MDIKAFWRAVLAQDEPEIRTYFAPDAYVNWHCTNEHFTVDEFITANCEYPGEWDGVVERIETLGGLTVTVTRVYPKDRSCSFHVTSFLRTENDRIVSLDEYWADDGSTPHLHPITEINFRKINRHSPYLSITLPKYYQYYL